MQCYARWVQVEPRNAYIRGDYGRDVVSMFLDFNSGERLAREALAIADFPHARQTLSMSLFGQWAQAAREGAGPDRIKALYDKAQANDPGGRNLPECLADWPPLQYVFVRLEQKSIRREQMHKC